MRISSDKVNRDGDVYVTSFATKGWCKPYKQEVGISGVIGGNAICGGK
jgi:hypothetical protein